MGSYSSYPRKTGLLFVLSIILVQVGCGERVRIAPVIYGKDTVRSDLRTSKGLAKVVVKRGDSLYKIARRYGVNLRRLIDANSINSPYIVYPGQRLLLPNKYAYTTVRRRRSENAKNEVLGKDQARPAKMPKQVFQTKNRAKRVLLHSQPKGVSQGFIWPVRGLLISKFGSNGKGLQNDGINISARSGTPVRAAQAGVVAYAGNELRGFGNLLLVRHAKGWISAYAHNSILLVETGDKVYRGQVISHVGNTGSVNFPQLHFELRRGKRPVDPERYLNRRRINLKG